MDKKTLRAIEIVLGHSDFSVKGSSTVVLTDDSEVDISTMNLTSAMSQATDEENEANKVRIVRKDKIRKWLKKNNKWDLFKRIRDARPAYLDNWEAKEDIDDNDELLNVVSQAINVSVTDVLTSSNLLTEEELQLSTAEEIEQAKDRAKALVNAERDRRKFLPITYEGNLYSVSEWDMIMIMSLLSASWFNKPLPTGDYWRTMNNTNVHLSSSDLNNLDNLIKAQIQDAYEWSWNKKSEIEACNSVAQVEALNLEITVD